MTPDINAIEERRKRLYKSDADNVYVEDYLADTEFLLNRINDLTTQLAEAKAGDESELAGQIQRLREEWTELFGIPADTLRKEI